MKTKLIGIDSVKGGMGDIWMRLVSLYSVSVLLPECTFKIKLPQSFKDLAESAFGDRLIIITKKDVKMKYCYTSLGLRHLIGPVIKGQRFIAPYQRIVINDKKQRQFKDQANTLLFNLADWLGVINVPAGKWINVYQGFLEIISIREIKDIEYDRFVKQLKLDYEIIYPKLQTLIAFSPELKIPHDLDENTLIFPTGTGRQFVPVWWAQKYMPDAFYAFLFKDKDVEIFNKAGLKTILFYEPRDIIKLFQKAKWTISTDSFPSHLLQYANKSCTILITGTLRSRIISPAFCGKVVNAEVACYPCLHMDKTNHPVCAAGYIECLNWMQDVYTKNIVASCNLQ